MIFFFLYFYNADYVYTFSQPDAPWNYDKTTTNLKPRRDFLFQLSSNNRRLRFRAVFIVRCDGRQFGYPDVFYLTPALGRRTQSHCVRLLGRALRCVRMRGARCNPTVVIRSYDFKSAVRMDDALITFLNGTSNEAERPDALHGCSSGNSTSSSSRSKQSLAAISAYYDEGSACQSFPPDDVLGIGKFLLAAKMKRSMFQLQLLVLPPPPVVVMINSSVIGAPRSALEPLDMQEYTHR